MSNSVGGCDPVEGSISKKRSRSPVWDHFDKTPDRKRAICKYCGNDLVAIPTAGTSHLKRHLETCKKRPQHVDQPLTKGVRNEVKKFGSTSVKTRDVEVKKAIVAEVPFAPSVSRKAYSRLMGVMDVHKEVCSYYEHEKEKLANQFQYLTSRVCISIEIDRMMKTLDYMSITAHFINEDFNLVKILIGFKTFPHDSSRLYKVQIIEKCISDWKFGDKMFSITGDDNLLFASSRASKEFFPTMLLEGLYSSYLSSYEQGLTRSYFQAVLSLLAMECADLQKFIKVLKGDPCKRDTFNQIAKKRGLHPINEDWLNYLNQLDPINFIFGIGHADVEKWEPVVKMFKEAMHYKDVFSQYAKINLEFVLENLGGCGLELSNSDIDWERVETVVKIFEKVHEIADRMNSFNYPTSNLYFWNLEEFEKIISTNENINKKKHAHFCYAICDYIFTITKNKVYFVACVLDPRYKLIFLKNYFEKPNGPHRPQPLFRNMEIINEIRDILQATFDVYVKGKTNEFANLQEEGCTSNSTHLSCPITDGFSRYTKELEKKNQKTELEEYLDDQLVDRDDASFNLLGWWKQNRLRYPVLSRMARDVLAIPTCVYSMKGKISSNLIAALEGVSPQQLVEAVICSKDWILSDLQSIPESKN